MIDKTGLSNEPCQCVACRSLRYAAIDLAIDVTAKEITDAQYSGIMETATRIGGFGLIHAKSPETAGDLIRAMVGFRNQHAPDYGREPWNMGVETVKLHPEPKAAQEAAPPAPEPEEAPPAPQTPEERLAWANRAHDVAGRLAEVLNADPVRDADQLFYALGLVAAAASQRMDPSQVLTVMAKMTQLCLEAPLRAQDAAAQAAA